MGINLPIPFCLIGCGSWQGKERKEGEIWKEEEEKEVWQEGQEGQEGERPYPWSVSRLKTGLINIPKFIAIQWTL